MKYTPEKMNRVHRVIIRDEEGEFISEARYSGGILYKQNRRYDIEISLDDFFDRLKTTKKLAENKGFTVVHDIVDNDVLWTV